MFITVPSEIHCAYLLPFSNSHPNTLGVSGMDASSWDDDDVDEMSMLGGEGNRLLLFYYSSNVNFGVSAISLRDWCICHLMSFQWSAVYTEKMRKPLSSSIEPNVHTESTKNIYKAKTKNIYKLRPRQLELDMPFFLLVTNPYKFKL